MLTSVQQIPVSSCEEIGLVILSAKALTPCWPVILDIKKASPAWRASPQLKIGDQIKEIDGIPTENLKYSQILNLFSKATDILHVVLRRGMEPTKRAFDWFRFPFLSVAKSVDEITIRSTTNLRHLYDDEGYCRIINQSKSTPMTSFMMVENEPEQSILSSPRASSETTLSSASSETTLLPPRYLPNNKQQCKKNFSQYRSLTAFSASAAPHNRNMFQLRGERTRQKTVQDSMFRMEKGARANSLGSSSHHQHNSQQQQRGLFQESNSLQFHNQHKQDSLNTNSDGTRSIFDEVELRRRLRSDSRSSSGIGGDMMSRKSSSQSSLASSASTISSMFASSTHIAQANIKSLTIIIKNLIREKSYANVKYIKSLLFYLLVRIFWLKLSIRELYPYIFKCSWPHDLKLFNKTKSYISKPIKQNDSSTQQEYNNADGYHVNKTRNAVGEGDDSNQIAGQKHNNNNAHKLRDETKRSFRIMKKQLPTTTFTKQKSSSNNTLSSNRGTTSDQHNQSATVIVTLWIPDRRKLGVKLSGGGCVSPYGDTNISVVEVMKTGTAHNVLRPGDEILEIDGQLTSGWDLHDVGNILKRLEGNYVELKIFRPYSKK